MPGWVTRFLRYLSHATLRNTLQRETGSPVSLVSGTRSTKKILTTLSKLVQRVSTKRIPNRFPNWSTARLEILICFWLTLDNDCRKGGQQRRRRHDDDDDDEDEDDDDDKDVVGRRRSECLIFWFKLHSIFRIFFF